MSELLPGERAERRDREGAAGGPAVLSRVASAREAHDETDRRASLHAITNDEISLSELVGPVLSRWRLVAALAVASAALALAATFVMRPKYAATVSFTPETSASSRLPGSLAGLAGIASQLGVGSALLGGSSSPDYYASLARSRGILESVLRTRFADSGSEESRSPRPLIEILDVDGRTEYARLRRAVRKMESRVSTDVDKATGVVRVTAEMQTPALAAAVANSLVGEINRFNIERKQSQSRAQRRFTEQRVEQAQTELRGAERALLEFLQANRSYRGSPLLEYEAGRLERAVQQKQQIYLALNQAYEEARIAEVQDTPVLTIIDAAVPPDRRSSPRRLLITAGAAVAGMLAGVAAAYAAAFARQAGRSARTPAAA